MLKEYYLCRCIDSVIRSKFADYPNLPYLRRGVAEIRFKKQRVKKIRICNTKSHPLHLRGAELFLRGGRLPAGDIPAFSCESGALLNGGELRFCFNEIVEPYMFHTSKGTENAWLEITFEEPVMLDAMTVYARTGEYNHARANCLAVDIWDDRDRKATVYDYQAALSECAEKIRDELLSSSSSLVFTSEQIRLAGHVLLSAHNDSLYDTAQDLRRFAETGADSLAVKKYVNDHILKERKKQFTMHFGAVYSFDLWSDEEKKEYLKAGLEVIGLIRNITDNVFFAYGTLLGFVREPGGFIPHDCDIDIAVVGKRSKYGRVDDLQKEVQGHLEKNGVAFLEVWPTVCHIRYKNSRKFDLFFRIEEDDGRVKLDYTLKKYVGIRDIAPTMNIRILGLDCPIPANPFAFLESIYGKDWRVPQDKSVYKKEEGAVYRTVSPDSVLFEEAMPVLQLHDALHARCAAAGLPDDDGLLGESAEQGSAGVQLKAEITGDDGLVVLPKNAPDEAGPHAEGLKAPGHAACPKGSCGALRRLGSLFRRRGS